MQRPHPESAMPNPIFTTEELSRALIANLPGGAAFVVDRDLRYLVAEGEALATAGFKPEDFIGRTIFEVLPPELAASYEPLYRQALVGEPFEHEHQAHVREASPQEKHTYISRGTPLRAENGEIHAVLVVSYDISERKQAEHTLRESEARLQQIANLVPDLLWDSEPDGSTNWYNQRWLEYTGQTFEQAISSGWTDAIHPDGLEGSARRYREAVEQGIPLLQEHRIRRHDGAYRWFVVKASPLKDESGKVIKMYGAATDIHEQRVALEALRESEAKYRSLFESMNDGFCIIELIYNEQQQLIDYHFLEANPAFERQSGLSNPIGKTGLYFAPNHDPELLANYHQALVTGAPVQFEIEMADLGRYYRISVNRHGDLQQQQLAIVFNDITDRKNRELNVAFLDEISKELSRLSAHDEIMQTVGARLGEFLGLSGCYFVDVDEAKNEVTVHYGWGSEKSPNLMQTFKLEDYLSEDFIHTMRAGEVFLIRDTAQDERAEAENYARLKVASFVTVPFLRNGRYTGHIAVTSEKPRDWQSQEIELLREIASRIFPRIERARAEAALRESEQKYRTLFDSIDEGLAIVEMIYDDQGEIVDIIYRQVNRAYERHGDVYNVVGRSIFDIIPGVEDYWLDLYKRIARTGEPVREENYQQDVDRWFDVYFSRIDDNGRFVAIVFSDITDRKRREVILHENQARQAFLLKLSEILQRFVQPNDIKTAAMRLLGEHLGVSRAQYHECDSSGEYYSADGVGYANGLPLLDLKYRIDAFGTFVNEDFAAGRLYRSDDLEIDPRVSAEEREAYRTYQIRAGAGMPLIRGGKLVAILAVHDVHPHHWTDLEMDLIRETAERIWTPLERARAEASLRVSEAKYRSLFESIDEGFAIAEVIYDASGQPVDILYLEANPAASRLTGVPDLTQQRLSEISPDWEPDWAELYDRVAQSGISERTERYATPFQRWYDFFVFRLEAAAESSNRRVAVIFQDITDRKQREQQQAFLLKFSDALRTEPDADAVANRAIQMLIEQLQLDRSYITTYYLEDNRADLNYQMGNDSVPPLPGYFVLSDFPEAFKTTFEKTVVIEDDWERQRLSEAEQRNSGNLGMRAMVAATLRKENHPLWSMVAISSRPRQWTPAEIALVEEVAERTWVAIERAKAEAALRESELQRVREQSAREQERQRAESLAELDRTKTLFFSNISHEFRTPLTLSLAPLQDVLSDPTLADSQRERLELIHRNSLRLLKLVNTLLDFSRIEAGRMEAVYEPTDLATYTADLSSVFRSAIERAGLQLIVDCPPLPEPVFVDREMWEKIVLNLLSNAFKFTFEGEIRVSLHATDNNQAVLQIQDTGTGIDPEHLPHLFERFYQVRGTQARTHEGSGIGLALVHELVRLQGGTIEVSSTPQEGTCFAIALPFGTEHLPGDRLQSEGDRQPNRTLASTAMGATAYVEEAERWLPSQNAAFRPPSSPILVGLIL